MWKGRPGALQCCRPSPPQCSGRWRRGVGPGTARGGLEPRWGGLRRWRCFGTAVHFREGQICSSFGSTSKYRLPAAAPPGSDEILFVTSSWVNMSSIFSRRVETFVSTVLVLETELELSMSEVDGGAEAPRLPNPAPPWFTPTPGCLGSRAPSPAPRTFSFLVTAACRRRPRVFRRRGTGTRLGERTAGSAPRLPPKPGSGGLERQPWSAPGRPFRKSVPVPLLLNARGLLRQVRRYQEKEKPSWALATGRGTRDSPGWA